MPVPLVILGVSAVSALGTAAVSSGAARALLKRQLTTHQADIERWALSAVAEQMGLPDLMDEHMTRKSFTNAINAAFLSSSDFKFTDIFDSQAVKDDAMRLGIRQAAEQAGLNLKSDSIGGMVQALREWVLSIVEDEIAMAEAGELIQDAAEVYKIIQLYRQYWKDKDGSGVPQDVAKKPLIDTKEARSNRERQATYRASHKRVWVQR